MTTETSTATETRDAARVAVIACDKTVRCLVVAHIADDRDPADEAPAYAYYAARAAREAAYAAYAAACAAA